MVSAFYTVSPKEYGAFIMEKYPLYYYAILDSGSSIHVWNDRSRFLTYRDAFRDYLVAGGGTVPILGYGEIDLKINGPNGPRIMRLYNVAYCEGFSTNLVSLKALRKRGIEWNTEYLYLYNKSSGAQLCYIHEQHEQFIIEEPTTIKASYATKRSSYLSSRTASADDWIWHHRLGHLGPDALKHLVNEAKGIKIKGVSTHKCSHCVGGGMKRQIQRSTPNHEPTEPGEYLAIDTHTLDPANKIAGGFKTCLLATCRYTGRVFDYYLTSMEEQQVELVIRDLIKQVERDGYKVKVIRADNELFKYSSVVSFLNRKGIKMEPSPPNTQALNGLAESSGGEVKQRARCMRLSSHLPEDIWPEIYKAAVYLINRSPKQMRNWQTPMGMWRLHLCSKQGIQQDYKPSISHLKVYGCLAYTMTADAQLKKKRRKRLRSRVNIGWLVGYSSTNIFRIWIPSLGKVVSMSDVLFDEDVRFKEDYDPFPANERTTVADYVQDCSVPESEIDNLEETAEEDDDILSCIVVDTGAAHGRQTRESTAESMTSLSSVPELESDQASSQEGTPPTTPLYENEPMAEKLASFFASVYSSEHKSSTEDEDTILRHFQGWNTGHKDFDAAYHAGVRYKGRVGTRQPSDKNYDHLMALDKPHRRDLPPEPRSYSDLSQHPLGEKFKQAQKDHLKGHEKMGTWQEVARPAKGIQVLGCMWVYVYKFDKHGYLVKCKARLVIRGDQEEKKGEDNYAATLAGRSFRTLMAMVTKFDLETAQYDAVNAFVHTDIDGDVYMEMPKGYKKSGTVYKLRKALFGLRRSPLLWQKDFTQALQALGFKQVPHEPCAMTKGDIVIFFYVDDLVFCFEEKNRAEMEETVRSLRQRFHLEGGGELQWFLGIEVMRNRVAKRMWLCQSSYIEKIGALASATSIKRPLTPMTTEELLPSGKTAKTPQRKRYQKKLGSLMYVTVMTRPDIAFAVSRLSRFSQNPGPAHEEAVDRVLRYLQTTKNYALQYEDGHGFQVSSDAAFADNILDRKSSQAFTMKLFGGLICWKATKQTTVTTSSTEAELLSLSYTAKEALYMNRLLSDLKLHLPQAPTIECDNQQTIRLVQNEINALQTRLRHVDIHNHWLRQEVQEGRIQITWTPTDRMLADGLTKALTGAKYILFREMMGLVDVSSEIQKRREQQMQDDLNY